MSVCVVGVARKIIITIAIISIGIININTSINTSIISIIIVYVYIGYNIGDTRILIPNISVTIYGL